MFRSLTRMRLVLPLVLIATHYMRGPLSRHGGRIASPRGAALIGVIAAFALSSGAASAAAPAFGLVTGPPLAVPVALQADESFLFQFGQLVSFVFEGGEVVEVESQELRGREFLEFSFFWGVEWRDYVRDGGDPTDVNLSDSNQQARLYVGTAEAPPTFVYLNKNPFTWPLSSEFVRFLGPRHLAILAAHGVPVSFTDPFGLADVSADPPMVFEVLPSTGGGGLLASPRDGTRIGWEIPVFAALAALVTLMLVGTLRRRRP